MVGCALHLHNDSICLIARCISHMHFLGWHYAITKHDFQMAPSSADI